MIHISIGFRENQGDDEYYQLLPNNIDNINASPFNPNLPTYFKYHGFNDNGLNDWIKESKTGK